MNAPHIPSRRLLLGAGVALLPAAAVVSPTVQSCTVSAQTGENPDAELIRLCGAAMAAEDAFSAHIVAQTTIVEEEANKDEENRLGDVVSDLTQRVSDTPAATLAGLAAKARAILHIGPRYPDGSPIIDGTVDEMRVTVLEELIALVAVLEQDERDATTAPDGRGG